MFSIQQWIAVGEYDVFVHAWVEASIPAPHAHDIPPEMTASSYRSNGVGPEFPTIRVLYINVECRNRTRNKTLSCRRNQWYLFDAEGYSYEAESDNPRLYQDQDRRFLGGERFLTPGTRVRGWLAFKLPENAVAERVQFITGFLGTKAADIALERVDR